MAALGQLATLVEGVDVGEEVGGVEEQAAEVQVEGARHAADEVAFDGGDGGGPDALEVFPEALGGELRGGQGEQAGEGGIAVPVGEGGLGAGRQAAVEDGGEQAAAEGGAGAALGGMAVDQLGQAEAAGEGEQGGGGAELADAGVEGLGGLGGLEAGEDGVGAAEVGLGDDFGSVLDALAGADVVAGVAADGLFDKARHGVRTYNSRGKGVLSSKKRKKCLHK